VAAPVVQLRVPDDTLARIDDVRGEETRSAWLLGLIDAELTGGGEAPVPAVVPGRSSSVSVAGDGEPSHGVLCMGPGCWQRDTRKYGLRRLPLCRACAGALRGEVYVPEVPAGVVRKLAKRGG
jgi:hypothetical protein